MKNILKATMVAAIAAVASYGIYTNQKADTMSDLMLANVESTAACESVGWWDNDGNCVKNDDNTYFCKSDSWYELTDCKQ